MFVVAPGKPGPEVVQMAVRPSRMTVVWIAVAVLVIVLAVIAFAFAADRAGGID